MQNFKGRIVLMAAAAQIDAAQNISLLSILQDYEEQFEFKYGRKPQLLQKSSSMVRVQ